MYIECMYYLHAAQAHNIQRMRPRVPFRWKYVAVCLLLLGFGMRGLAAEPSLEKIDVFVGGEGGYALYRIPGLVVSRAGTALAYAEGRRNGRSDWGTIDIVLRRSHDGGKT